MIGRGAVTRRIGTARAAVSRVVLPTDDRSWLAKILSRRVAACLDSGAEGSRLAAERL